MSHLRAAVGVVVLSMLLPDRPALADDWPQWRGPKRDGHSREVGLLKAWPNEGPRLLWQVKDLGRGYSTPAVAGGRLYVLTNKGLDDEFVTARDATDGRLLWSTRIGKVGRLRWKKSLRVDFGGQPGTWAYAESPLVDGDVVVSTPGEPSSRPAI